MAKTISASRILSLDFEEGPERRLVDLHLGPADSEGSPAADALAILVAVGRLDALDPGGGNGVQVDRDFQGR